MHINTCIHEHTYVCSVPHFGYFYMRFNVHYDNSNYKTRQKYIFDNYNWYMP